MVCSSYIKSGAKGLLGSAHKAAPGFPTLRGLCETVPEPVAVGGDRGRWCFKPAVDQTFLIARGAGKTTPLDRPSSTPSSTVE